MSNYPPELVSIDHLSSYLSQTAPVDFAPDWPFKDRIVEEARKAGLDLNTVRLVLRRLDAQVEETEGEDETEGEPRTGEPWEHEVFKPYRPTHKPFDREPVKVTGVNCVVDDGPNPKWWGWTGEIKLLAGLVDADAAGFRIRMQNIQVDGTEITDRIFTRIGKSYDRLNIWFIGEIHMIGQDIVPNARRDGFEENTAWRDVQESLIPWFKTLSARAYKTSRTRGILAKKVKAAVAFAAVSRSRLAEGITADERQRLLLEIDEPVGVLKDELNADVVSAEDTAILRRTIGELNGLRKAVEAIKPIVEGRIPALELDASEVLAIAFSVLEERLGPLDYRRTRRAIEERVENVTRSRKT